MSAPQPFPSTEKTFKSYTSSQGKTYAQARPTYNPKLYTTVLTHHGSTGGQHLTILDVGCGPGIAARALAPHFNHVIGLDPSKGMIDNARSLGGTSASGESIRYEISTAEDLGWHLDPAVEDGSVDLITASTAAHWFDMTAFWPRAAKVLKPGGTVAIWGSGQSAIHPSMPNAEALNVVLTDLEERDLQPFFEPGNWLTRSLYEGLPLPWTLDVPVPEFDEESFVRKEWGTGENDEDFFTGGALTMDLDMLEKMMSTASPVQRWREAHPELVGTEKDVVKRMRSEIERLLAEVGVEKGKEIIQGTFKGVLLMVKKKA
ncbi:hypothetical protein VTL71DRAFT_399 [Oculimacula yallundae]|uniref:Methyltransferase type 11 domain-containing protein n=1 Tax=Oculimacula yallundae TaxID=86028 RepID=A0ABR4D108_9HELO